VVAFILTYTYLPAMLQVWKAGPNPKSKKQESALDKNSHTLFFWVIRHGKPISLVTCLIVLLSVWGLCKIIPDQKLLDDLSDKETVKQDFLFFEENYGGVRPLEIDIKVNDKHKTIWSYDIMKQLNRVDSFITKTYKPGFLVSPAGLVKSVNEAYNDTYILPNDTEDYNRDIKFILQNKNRKEFKQLIASAERHSRISGKIKDYGSLKVDAFNRQLAEFIKSKTDSNRVKFTVTGTTNLIDLNNKYLVQNTMQGLLTGILALALLTYIIHRSLKMVLVFLIPNVVPLLIMAGIMGFFNIPLKASTAIFFSIAFGIATDDTIHFISRFKLELKKNSSPLRAFKHTYAETGKPVFLTTLILLGGFVSLILSDFESIRLFGLLTCLTLLVALLAEIVLLPVLLMVLFKKKK
jgi:predicted RND superfamily exporter protein